jgi:AcrR family transcriptional regulator
MVERETVDGVPGTGSRLRLTALERRTGIIAAARTEFARVGYQGASTASIARRAGCSEPMLYKHFSGKRELFLEALRAAAGRIQARLDELAAMQDGDVRDLLRAFAEQQEHDDEYQSLVRLRLLAISLADDDEVRRTIRGIDAESRRRIVALVRRGQDQGDLRGEVDPEYVSATWLALTFAHSYGAAFDSGPHTNLAWLAERFVETISAE